MADPVRFKDLPHGRVIIFAPVDHPEDRYALVSATAAAPAKPSGTTWLVREGEAVTFRPDALVTIVDGLGEAPAAPVGPLGVRSLGMSAMVYALGLAASVGPPLGGGGRPDVVPTLDLPPPEPAPPPRPSTPAPANPEKKKRRKAARAARKRNRR